MGEDLAARVEHFQRIRDLQDETGGFTAFISWTFQHEHTDMPDVPETFATSTCGRSPSRASSSDNITTFRPAG
jgi:2-iminoacetate synthase ThiH